jgi:rhodanese-related sulfurtransferase
MKNTMILSLLVTLATVGKLRADEIQVPDSKKTELGLYVTSRQAYDKWKADPEKIKIIDVRTPEEYTFVGHPEMAWNVPLMFLTYQWDTERKRQKMRPNEKFLEQVKKIIEPDDTVLVTCRSGGRSAMAVNMLAKAGFKNVYSIIDGVEGDTVTDPDSVFVGQRMKNGWKNAGLPWTCKVDPELMYLEKQ